MPPASVSALTRRALLAGTLGVVAAPLVLGGCTSDPEPAAATPDETSLDFTVTSASELLAAYTATTAAHPALAPRLDPLAADHRTHLAALDPGASPSPTPTPRQSPSATVPADPASAQAALAAAETAAAAALTSRLGPIDANLARTLASVAACRAAHAADLAGAL